MQAETPSAAAAPRTHALNPAMRHGAIDFRGIYAIDKYGDSVLGRLAVERVVDFSDAELDRCLTQTCVCPDLALYVAKEMRGRGLLTMAAVEAA